MDTLHRLTLGYGKKGKRYYSWHC